MKEITYGLGITVINPNNQYDITKPHLSFTVELDETDKWVEVKDKLLARIKKELASEEQEALARFKAQAKDKPVEKKREDDRPDI